MMLDLNRVMPSAGDAAEAATPSPRLENAAHQFEAFMLQELLKPLQEQSALSGENEDEDSNSSLREYGSEVMARALSERGGLGISKMVLGKLAPIEAAQEGRKSIGLRKTPSGL